MTPAFGPSLDERLTARFDVVETRAVVAGREFALKHPRSADDLLDEKDFDENGRIPYWANLWPSARVLARRLATEQGSGRRLLELGCGMGLVSLAALAAGFDVLATDYYEEALDFTRLNAARNGLAEPATRVVDWRSLPADLGRYDRVVAADVLYERDYAALVAATFAATLAPGARGLLTDPGRHHAATFTDQCRQLGLRVLSHERIAYDDEPPECTIDLYEIENGG